MYNISIIIATYNAEKYLQECINSIVNQSDFTYELIIIDGNSNDSTCKIIKDNIINISYYVSEKDNGIYDAWNKGLKVAKGKWIMFMGADDILNPNTLNFYNKVLESHLCDEVDFISGKIELVTNELKTVRYWGWPWHWQEFRRKIRLAHTTSLHSASYFEKYGNFDVDYKIAGDYEILLRAKDQLKTIYIEHVTGKQRIGGISSKMGVFPELRRAMIITGGETRTFANLIFLKNVITYFTKSLLSILKLKTHVRNAQ